MGKYEKIGWIDSPATDTPINSDNLNHMDEGIYNADAKAEDASIIGYSNSEVITDSISGKTLGLKAYGKCYYGTATPSPTNPQEVETWNGTITTSNGSESSFADLGIELYGMRVTYGGNYKDSEGQDWWSDKADFLNGTIERNVALLELDSEWDWQSDVSGVFYVPNFRQNYNVATIGHCNKLQVSFVLDNAPDYSIIISNDLIVKVPIANISTYKTWLASAHVYILYNYIEKTYEAISQESLNALANLDVYAESTAVSYGTHAPFAWLGYPKDSANAILFTELNETVNAHVSNNDRHVTEEEKENWNSKSSVTANPRVTESDSPLTSLQIGAEKFRIAGGGGGGASSASDVALSPTSIIPSTNVQSAFDYISGGESSDIATIQTESMSGTSAAIRVIYPSEGINEVVSYKAVTNSYKEYSFFAVGYFTNAGGWNVKALKPVKYNGELYSEGQIVKTFAYNVQTAVDLMNMENVKTLFVVNEEGKSLVSEEEKKHWNEKADALVGISSDSHIDDTANGYVVNVDVYGQCIQDAEPTVTNPQALKVWDGTITTKNDDGTLQTVAELGIEMYGMKTDSDGNYTDSDGQMWLCDKIDMRRGKIIRNFGKSTLSNPSSNWRKSSNYDGGYYISNWARDNSLANSPLHLQTHFTTKATSAEYDENTCVFNNALNIRFPSGMINSVEELREWFNSNTVDLIYVLPTSEEEDLTEAQIAALKKLQTYAGGTDVELDKAFFDFTYWKNNLSGQAVADVDAKLNKLLELQQQ